MARPATSRLKVNPPLGRMPVLQFCAPGELDIDPAYQRDVTNGSSLTLIRRLAQHWNWDLCQPLVVARRAGGGLFVIDGQHRLEAARLRGDIPQLPCVVVDYAIFPGIVAVCSDEMAGRKPFGGEHFERFYGWVGKRRQDEWRSLAMRLKADEPELKYGECSGAVFRREWRNNLYAAPAPVLVREPAKPQPNRPASGVSRAFKADGEGKSWCDQCDQRRTVNQAMSCGDQHCPLRLASAA